MHMVPWKTALGYDVALAMDFIGISWGFTSHSILWTGGVHSFSQFGAVAVFACMCLMQVAAFKQKNKRVLMFMRRRRLTLRLPLLRRNALVLAPSSLLFLPPLPFRRGVRVVVRFRRGRVVVPGRAPPRPRRERRGAVVVCYS